MKYETPKMTALTPAINVIQSSGIKPDFEDLYDSHTGVYNEQFGTYTDWE